MKWLLAAALGLLLVIVCVEYLRYEKRPSVQSPVVAVRPEPRVHPKPKAVASQPAKQTVLPPSPIDISGPLKDRALVHWVLPEYPEWAEEQGITGLVQIKIWVTPGGQVKSFMQPQRMSGEPRLEEKAVDALRQWEFVEKPNAFGDQWGIVTMRFALLSKADEKPGASMRGVLLGGKTASGAWDCVRQWLDGVYVYVCKRGLKTSGL